MAAGLGFKTFNTGEVLTSADVNGYLMQGVLVFASEAARNAAITSPQEGQFAYTKDNNSLWYYTGSAWAASGATGDIEGVTAGTGISGGGTSGTVTITNSMATAIDAKGDLIVGTGADTFSRLAVGTNGQVLTADSSEATGLKFATPASGGGMTLISETVASALSSLTFSSLGSYKQLVLMYSGIRHSDNASSFVVRLNNDSGNNYFKAGMSGQGSTLRLGGDDPTHLGDSNNATWCAFGVGTNNANLSTYVMGYIVIDNYTSSTKGKAVFAVFNYFNNGVGGGYYAQSLNHFVNITSAITSIDVVRLTGTGTFSNTANTTIRLYGVN